ncbi:CBS domain-containing protein [Alloacidobacterium dinghuense]|uniref:Zinc metalloprotease n=1 Tax=Alloacidobacterium dinghuense TaxID=2763107 RepID=A0A7G8BGV7_9BACT|nr:CBS domain-containing protein [Alloacidobacterium dinghuense]QNI31777.1 CBS domain-containing protein [Alloacidobacterium dinghuense]
MRGWSFPLGRWMGVDLRIHTFFLLLLGLCLLSTNLVNVQSWRAIMLWLILLLAVVVREIARVIVAAYHGVQLRSILLLPIGGLFSYANPDSAERAGEGSVQASMAIVGPLANFSFAIAVGTLIAGAAPQVAIFAKPWVTPTHLMRSAVWLNVILGILNFIPAYPLDAGRMLRGGFTRTRGAAQATRAASGLGQILGLIAVLGGIALLFIPNSGLGTSLSPWLIMGGFFIFVGGQLEDQGLMFQSVVDTVTMRDVMLTDFSTLAPHDTLEDALYKAIHSLQDEFPVVRGANLVGIVSRQGILEALRSDGNGYVQSVMSRTFQVAQPNDSLGSMIRRMAGGRMSLVPVTEGDKIIGIVTLQNLMHSMGMLAEHRRLKRVNE